MKDIYNDRMDIMAYLKTLCEREQISWQAFMDIFHPHILAVVRRSIPSLHDRDDVSQVIYEKLLENDKRLLCQYDGNYQNFVFYLRRIAKNIVISYRKRNLRNNCGNLEHYENDLADARENVEATLVLEEKVDVFRDSLSRLKPLYRNVLFLLVEGYSHREIAEKLGLSLNTVLTRSARGKLILRNIVKENYEKPGS